MCGLITSCVLAFYNASTQLVIRLRLLGHHACYAIPDDVLVGHHACYAIPDDVLVGHHTCYAILDDVLVTYL